MSFDNGAEGGIMFGKRHTPLARSLRSASMLSLINGPMSVEVFALFKLTRSCVQNEVASSSAFTSAWINRRTAECVSAATVFDNSSSWFRKPTSFPAPDANDCVDATRGKMGVFVSIPLAGETV